jgi:hypothetical protein
VLAVSAHDIQGLIAVIGAFAVPLLGIVAWVVAKGMGNWRKVRVSEHLAALKQTMIERGMSAEEIERVLAAGVPAHEESHECSGEPSRRERCRR